jgi:hypothetical protein
MIARVVSQASSSTSFARARPRSRRAGHGHGARDCAGEDQPGLQPRRVIPTSRCARRTTSSSTTRDGRCRWRVGRSDATSSVATVWTVAIRRAVLAGPVLPGGVHDEHSRGHRRFSRPMRRSAVNIADTTSMNRADDQYGGWWSPIRPPAECSTSSAEPARTPRAERRRHGPVNARRPRVRSRPTAGTAATRTRQQRQRLGRRVPEPAQHGDPVERRHGHRHGLPAVAREVRPRACASIRPPAADSSARARS